MDNETLIDLKLKVKYRLPEYLEKAKLPLDKSDPENPRTICPCCRHNITLDENLLLKGLLIIWEKNRGNRRKTR